MLALQAYASIQFISFELKMYCLLPSYSTILKESNTLHICQNKANINYNKSKKCKMNHGTDRKHLSHQLLSTSIQTTLTIFLLLKWSVRYSRPKVKVDCSNVAERLLGICPGSQLLSSLASFGSHSLCTSCLLR